MMKEEFEKFVGETVSNEDYNVIETVYIWHPSMIAGAKQNAVLKLLNSGYWFNTSKPWYTFGALIYLVLIFAFSYFYTEITMNPEEIANNIKKSGGNIAGIRAGSSTAEYLRKQMKYLIAIGSFCLCIIAIIPFIVSGLTGLSRLSFLVLPLSLLSVLSWKPKNLSYPKHRKTII